MLTANIAAPRAVWSLQEDLTKITTYSNAHGYFRNYPHPTFPLMFSSSRVLVMMPWTFDMIPEKMVTPRCESHREYVQISRSNSWEISSCFARMNGFTLGK